MDKRRFYSQPRVVRSYDALRFGGASGCRVDRRELELVSSLLPASGLVLDLGCGTGRLAAHLAGRGYKVVGVDVSPEMLASARRRGALALVQADAFRLPFRDATFDAVAALRVVFHFQDAGALLQEASRVLAPGGSLVFDSYRWSPRSPWALGRGQWGERVYARSDRALRRVLGELGLEPVAAVRCFLCSPYVYRLLPLAVEQALERLERVVPDWLLARTFWLARSAPRAVARLRAA